MKNEEDHKTRTKVVTLGSHHDDVGVKIGGEWKFQKNPAFLQERLAYFDELYKKQEAVYAAYPHQPIKITLPDGAVKEGVSFETSPFDIAKGISSQMAKKIVVAKVRYVKRIATLDEGLLNPEAEEGVSEDDQWFFWDVNRVLEGDCDMKLFKFEDQEGRETFWHSSAHILGETLENEYGVHLCVGPPTEEGFFYDSYTGKDIFNESQYKTIEKAAMKIVDSKQTFYRLVLTKDEALKLFAHNNFKVSMITNKIPDGSRVTAYKCGSLIDLCTGPHIPATTMIKAFRIEKNSSAYWLGKAGNDSLQRVYGITFPDKKMMADHIHFQEEAKKRDHRTIGMHQDIFHINQLSPGCAFFYPKGTIIYNNLVQLIKNEYRVRGYNEVISPNLFNLHLWKTSGHYVNYKDNIFTVKCEDHGFGVKPMNCPGHCLMFANELRTYRELPVRLCDFGVLHRNEISGALTGLIRVRRFQQDDAHIFCSLDQVSVEVQSTLDFLEHVYGIFGFTFELELSTRPENRLGSDAMWDKAEGALEEALNAFGKPWKLNPGDGAFYGPKIDIKVFDALRRQHQCGTVQLDFQLPIRFNLQYKTDAACDEEQPEQILGTQEFPADENDNHKFIWQEQKVKPGFARPVIVHRAILGSVERFMAILIEHLAGKWPFFISPRQVLICPVGKIYQPYCEKVYQYLHQRGYHCELDLSQKQLPNRIRIGKEAQWNYIIVAGEKEMANGTVDVNPRDKGDTLKGQIRIDHLHEKFQGLMPAKSGAYQRFYSNIWRPEDYPLADATLQAQQVVASASTGVAKFKLVVENNFQTMAQMVQVCADLAGQHFDVAVSSDKSISPNNRLPVMDCYDQNKTRFFETEAMLQFLARSNPSANLNGSTPFQGAQINQWITWCQRIWIPKMHGPLMPVLGHGPPNMKRYTDGTKECKQIAKILDNHLQGKKWLVGDSMTIADLYLGSAFILAFQLMFDAGFRKAHKNFSAWFQNFIDNKAVQKRFGKITLCATALKPAGGAPAGGAPAAAPAQKAAAKKEEDDDLDLFGDDADDGAAAAAAAAAAAKAKGKKKEKPPEMSLIIFEVKPMDDQVNLDDLAARIFANKRDGLVWKSGQYTKEPVAFGIFKLILGFSCEDSKVSVDDIQEEIEAMEDMVQSVEIASFTKI